MQPLHVGSIAELAPRLRWAAAVAVRAHDRGQTAQLVANARDQLSPPDGGRRMGNMPTSGGGGSVTMASASRNSNTANSRRTMSASSAAIAAATEHAQAVEMKQRTLLMSTGLAGTMAREKVIDDLESQLGDVAVERYKDDRDSGVDAIFSICVCASMQGHRSWWPNVDMQKRIECTFSLLSIDMLHQHHHQCLHKTRAVCSSSFDPMFWVYSDIEHRYKTAQQGLEQLKSEAFAWAARVGDEADQAAAEVGTNRI